MKERDKYLTEKMGICPHKWYKKEGFIQGHHCKKCDAYWPVKPNYPLDVIDFSTWPGFGILWEWAQDQDWFGEFGNIFVEEVQDDIEEIFLGPIIVNCINPDRFATAVYEFLRERET